MLLVLAFALYLSIGAALVGRGMLHARTHAMVNDQFFTMAVQRQSLTMRVAALCFAVTWLPALLFVVVRAGVHAALRPRTSTATI